MAPIPDSVDDRLKDVIQDLYEIQSSVHGYLGPETQQELVRKITQLTSSLHHLSLSSSSLPTQLPPEIIEYIDQGRNPDIYNRELVEAVQKSNQYLKGKSEAFAGFRDMLAEEIVRAKPESENEVRRVVGGGRSEEAKTLNGEVGGEEEGT
ncbi:RNA polymerase II mediator complex subunit [Lecanora helva]